jgi:hypothetical protein
LKLVLTLHDPWQLPLQPPSQSTGDPVQLALHSAEHLPLQSALHCAEFAELEHWLVQSPSQLAEQDPEQLKLPGVQLAWQLVLQLAWQSTEGRSQLPEQLAESLASQLAVMWTGVH